MALAANDLAVLEAVAERLIPSDEHGPGAGQSGAAAYIERALDGAYAHFAPTYATVLALLGADFAERAPEQQDAALARLETSDRASFDLVREHVFEGMFGDPAYGGNRDHAGWRLLGYPGPRREWTPEEQALDFRPEDAFDSAR